MLLGGLEWVRVFRRGVRIFGMLSSGGGRGGKGSKGVEEQEGRRRRLGLG